MIGNLKMALYNAAPVALQELALSLYARHLDRLYYGPVYKRALRDIEQRPFYTLTDMLRWQEQQLLPLVSAARRHVPHYRETMAGSPELHEFGDLASLPLLNKQEIRQHERFFIDERLSRASLHADKTSGTTGTSLTIFWDKPSLQRFWAAHEARVRQVIGVSRFTPRAMVGGRSVVAGDVLEPPFWRYNRHWRQLYLSSYHICKGSAPGYIEAIRRAGSVWLTGYGSAISALAESALAAGVPPLPLKAVVVSGDTLQPGMRQSIEKFFQCTCYDQYGQCEGVCWIMECPAGRMHVAPEFGILEILDPNGDPCPPGVPGEMVATGLLNTAMPLLRYRTGDEAAWAQDQVCHCGQPFPIVERIEGRVDDYLITSTGRKIGRLSTGMKGGPGIHSAQIVQDAPGHAWLLVRPGSTYTHSDAERVKRDLLDRIGAFNIDVLVVEKIPSTKTGKGKLVVRFSDKPELRSMYSNILPGRNASRPASKEHAYA